MSMTSFKSGTLNMNFALKVAKQVLQVDATAGGPYVNLACSPLSITAALCVLVAGSGGDTREQLLRVLEQNTVDEVNDMASRLEKVMKGDDDNDENGPRISFAYALWVNMNFALKVAKQVLQVDATAGGPYVNLACSPLSITAALCVLVAGSGGDTREQLLRVLEQNTVDEVNDMASRLEKVMKGDDDNDENGPRISFAYALWVAHPLVLKKDFKQILWDLYKTKATTLDFNHVDKVVDEVNLWAEKQSKGSIKQILLRDRIDQDMAMILANALHFEGVWDNCFESENTRDKCFYLLNGNKVEVPFMKIRDTWFNYGTSEGFKIIRMPYVQGKTKTSLFSMYIFLPEEKDGLPGLMESINLDTNLFENQIRLDCVCIKKLQIPKFDFECSVKLLPKAMKNLGLTHIFDETRLDLMKMVQGSENGDEVLYVSDIHQKCRIETNENGTKADAFTIVEFADGGFFKKTPTVNFVANHPFMFMIIDDFSGVVLFVGTVLDPLTN